MANNLFFLIDDSIPYLDDKVKEILSSFDFPFNLNVMSSWVKDSASVTSLFGEKTIVRLHLENSQQVEAFSKMIKKNKNFFMNDWYGNGVIITSTISKGTKAIETLVSESNGTIIKKRKPDEVKNELLNKLKLSQENLMVLSNYVGDDYNYLINITNTIGKLPEKEQKEMTLNELFIYLPSKPGELPPWDFLNNIFELNLEKALNNASRGLTHKPIILMIILLKNKLDLLYKYTLLNLEKKTDKQKVEILKRKSPYEFISFNKMKRKPSIETAEFVLKLICKAEKEVKGESVIPNDELFLHNVISKIIISLKENKPIEGV